MQRSCRRRWPGRCPGRTTGLALLAVSFAGVGCATIPRPPCVEQSTEALREIRDGRLDLFAPAVARWEAEQARACGWVLPKDFNEPDPD